MAFSSRGAMILSTDFFFWVVKWKIWLDVTHWAIILILLIGILTIEKK